MSNFDTRHGGPFDRGGADYWYNRGYTPHYYTGNTYTSDRVTRDDMTAEELAAYRAGYELAEQQGDQKEYG
jgi:hypothetical protein